MDDDPHYWTEEGHIWEYVPMAGPTLIGYEEVCRRLNHQWESLMDYQRQKGMDGAKIHRLEARLARALKTLGGPQRDSREVWG